jgi:hypothetical protein
VNDTLNVMAPHFNATIQFKKGNVENASPCLMWLMGRSEADVKRIITQRGWTWKELMDAGSH